MAWDQLNIMAAESPLFDNPLSCAEKLFSEEVKALRTWGRIEYKSANIYQLQKGWQALQASVTVLAVSVLHCRSRYVCSDV